MEDVIELYLKGYINTISETSIKTFKKNFKERSFKKGETLIQQGTKSTNVFIIRTGLVASFITLNNKSEFIRTIYKPLDELGSLACLIKNVPANANYRCLSNGILIEGNFNDFVELMQKEESFLLLYTRILERLHLIAEKRLEELSSLDATERYIQLKKDIRGIDNLLPQHQIAKYLNITPVQLSRIRKKLSTK